MKSKLLYGAGTMCLLLFGTFYVVALSGPHRAVPWLLVAYAVFPVALILLIVAERTRRRGHIIKN
jgi:hypothetical protein